MSFAFGFTNDDSSDDELTPVTQQAQAPPARALDTFSIPEDKHPQRHTLESICSTLINVRITFDNYTTPGGNLIYRRELFDVKHQIMSEDNCNTSDLLLDEQSDLQRNIYEGGFKSWECSYDAVDQLAASEQQDQFTSVLEYGCGTALPSCFLLLRKFTTGDTKNKLRITLSDFNFDVLRLVTIANLIINWASTLPVEKLHALTTSEENPVFNNDEVLITQELINEFITQLQQFNIELDFISGSWGREFNQLVTSLTNIDFIITSETIYSPEILPIVAESIVEILQSSLNGKCLVAAKNIYFGVGGSVIEFVNYFNRINCDRFKVEVQEINDSQLKRSLIMIEKK
ncbi:Histidine protein methyltransferase 1 [Spathaspora sp. JA1]|nr:Histidine protein methyltransferase 1 [Spathaspora sp. JA1]